MNLIFFLILIAPIIVGTILIIILRINDEPYSPKSQRLLLIALLMVVTPCLIIGISLLIWTIQTITSNTN